MCCPELAMVFQIVFLYSHMVMHSYLLFGRQGLQKKANDFHKSRLLERFSFECRKVIGFALSTRCDWLKRFAPPFHPIRSKTKANCDALACIFPRFASATCNYFEF